MVDATGQSVESKKMRGWRVALAKQAGVSVDDLRIVKTANQPRTQRGGGRSTVVLTYEFSVNASEPCVSTERCAFWLHAPNATLSLMLPVRMLTRLVCTCVSGGCSGSYCGRCSFTILRYGARGRHFFLIRGWQQTAGYGLCSSSDDARARALRWILQAVDNTAVSTIHSNNARHKRCTLL